jgi:hypothetical protein
MSIKKTVYQAIREKILEETGVKTSRLYNSQFDNLEEEATFTFPAAFIEFSQLDYSSNAEGTQEAATRIRIYLGYDSLKTEDLEILDLLEDVHKSLQGFSSANGTSPLNRVFEGQDINHGTIAVWVIDYETRILDSSGHRNNRLTSVNLEAIEVIGESEKPRLKYL